MTQEQLTIEQSDRDAAAETLDVHKIAALCSKRTNDGANRVNGECECHSLRCGDGGINLAPHHGNRP